MKPEELKAIDSQRQMLLEQLTVAEAAVRRGLEAHGFGSTAQAHMERALAHILEARLAINEINRARSVEQLVNDLVHVRQVMDAPTRGRSQRI